MINFRLAAFGAVALMTLTACSKSDDAVETAAVAAVSESGNSLFAYVPADTPYLVGNLQPPPDEVIDTFLQRFQPVLDAVQTELHKARQSIEAESGDGSQTPDETQNHDMGVKLMHAVLQELDGKLNRPGLESMGFDLQSHKVIYGMGAFPVIRLGLSDAAALRESIMRVLGNAGISAPELNHQGVSYWRLIDEEENEEDNQEPAGLYVSILDDHLAMSVFPPSAEAELLPAFLGVELPKESNAAARLAELNAEHGYTAFGSGILDLNRLLDEFITPDTVLARTLAASGEFDPASMTPECTTEIRSIVSNTPRMTMGVTELTSAAIGIQYRVETAAALAQQLGGLVAEIPAADSLSERILEFSFGMRFGAARDFLREKAAAIMETPYQCEHLQEINQSATEAFTQLNQPMPPFVNNFRGLRLSLSEIMMTDSIPENARGMAAVHVDQPEMFVGMAQMFLPDLSGLSLVPGEPPVQLPASMIPVPGVIAFAALSQDAIGLSLGEGEQAGLLDYLDEKPGPSGTFLSTSYDMAAYLDYTQKMTGQNQDYDGETDGVDPTHAAHYQSFMHISEAAQEAFKAFADRSQASLRFTPEGFVADSRMTFK
jgi:hypothetical protein